MGRASWMKQVGFCFVVVAMLLGPAWADPIGTADVRQILNPETFDGTSAQRTIRTTDGTITFNATYYDSNPACSGVPPAFAQIFFFTLEGELINQFTAGAANSSIGPKYRLLNIGLDASLFGAGSFKFSFLVRDCTHTRSVVLPEFVTFRVIAP